MNAISQRAPLSLSLSTVANGFFSVGLVLIVVDAFLFQQILALATTPFSTRAFFGFHLYPSEIWFLFIGNGVTLLLLGRDRLVIPRYLVENAIPLFVVLGVYSIWFVYGFLLGNGAALQEFREMVFSALALPAILYLAPHASARLLFQRLFVPICVAVAPIAVVASRAGSGFAVHNSVLVISAFAAGYYFFRLLNGSRMALFGLAVISAAFLIKFSKPMVALLLAVYAITFLLSGRVNPDSVRWVLSRFKLRMVNITLFILGLVALMLVGINLYYDGLIEMGIRYLVLKERFTAVGEVQYGDVTGGRFAIWKAALVGWTERPWLGHGLGSTVAAYGTGWLTKTQFHNYILQALHNTGTVGVLLMVSAWFVWFRRTLGAIGSIADARARALPATMLIYVFGLFVYGLYGHSLSYPPSAQLFWLCIGFLSVYRRGWE